MSEKIEFPSKNELFVINTAWDLGYTSADKDKLMKDFGMTEEEATYTCEKLKDRERFGDIGSAY